jgi:SOS-response transcriptional repressor LexA
MSRIERLKVLLDRFADGEQTKLAQLIGKQPGQISHWFTGYRQIGEKVARDIEVSFNLPQGWLDGHDERSDQHNRTRNITEEMRNLGKVPLIDWEAVGDFCGLSNSYRVEIVEEWLYCPSKHGPKTFALRVRGESMYNPSGSPSFNDGDIIFVDPDRRAIHKSLVICLLGDTKEATFKRLLTEGETKMVEALNPSWPERIVKVNGDARICGVVIGRYVSF